MTSKKVSAERLDNLPIFPLQGAVLIPQGHLPLHVFEPRYRQLVEDVMQGDRILAIGSLKEGEVEGAERPEIESTLGVGVVDIHQPLGKERLLIVLRGLQRVNFLSELDVATPYRMIRASQIFDEPTKDLSLLEQRMTILRKLVVSLGGLVPDNAGQTLVEVCMRQDDPAELADLVGSAVIIDPKRRLRFLEERDICTRLDYAARAVAEAVDRLRPADHDDLN